MDICLPEPEYGKILVVHTGIGEELDIMLEYLSQKGYGIPTRDNSTIEEHGTDACVSVRPGLMVAKHAALSYYQSRSDMYQIVEFNDVVQQPHELDISTFQALI